MVSDEVMQDLILGSKQVLKISRKVSSSEVTNFSFARKAVNESKREGKRDFFDPLIILHFMLSRIVSKSSWGILKIPEIKLTPQFVLFFINRNRSSRVLTSQDFSETGGYQFSEEIRHDSIWAPMNGSFDS